MSETSSNTPLSDNNDFETNDNGSATMEVDVSSLLKKFKKLTEQTNDFRTNDNESATMEVDVSSLLRKLEKLTRQTNDNLQEHEHILQSVLNYANTVFESSNCSYWEKVTLLGTLLS
jgi:ribosomal protein S15P/S13E